MYRCLMKLVPNVLLSTAVQTKRLQERLTAVKGEPDTVKTQPGAVLLAFRDHQAQHFKDAIFCLCS